jgi:hypothetical protein
VGEPRSVTIEACPYEDGSGAEFKVKVERDPKFGLRVSVNDYVLWFAADKWPALRDAVDEALRPFATPGPDKQ